METQFDVKSFDIALYDKILERGLSNGLGKRDGQMCIEAAICTALHLDHGDDPKCIAESVRSFKIALNDSQWSSTAARAAGLRDLGIAQLGSLGVVDDREFARIMAEQTTRVLIPQLFRKIFTEYPDCLAAADKCESKGTYEAATRAARAAEAAEAAWTAEAARAAEAAEAAWTAWPAWAAWAARTARTARAAEAAETAGTVWAVWAAGTAWAARTAWTARAAEAAWTAWTAEAARAAEAKTDPDYYLKLSASFALAALHELKSPGCALLEK